MVERCSRLGAPAAMGEKRRVHMYPYRQTDPREDGATPQGQEMGHDPTWPMTEWRKRQCAERPLQTHIEALEWGGEWNQSLSDREWPMAQIRNKAAHNASAIH